MSGLARVLTLAASFLAVAQPSAASDLSWSGCYGGADVGYGWADIGGRDRLIDNNIGSATATGGAFGVQLGCDRQTANWVLGAQASLAKADITGNHRYHNGSGPSDRVRYDIDTLATLAGRVGYAFAPDTLVYLKAGGAWVRIDHRDSDPAPSFGPPYTGNRKAHRSGWLLGLGAERRVGRNLSAYAEYQHMDFGHANVTISYSDGAVSSYSFRQRIDYVAVGLNYRF
jgi:outer membrane immunogenic protein